MEPIIISIAEQIIVVVVLSLLAGFAIGWLSACQGLGADR